MSALKVNQIKATLRKMFEQHLYLSDISPRDAQRDVKILTRCLAAFAIYHETGCSAKEAAQAVWDGSDDNGIDAASYDPADSRVVFVQSKWIEKGAGEPEAADVGTFVKGVRDAIEHDYTDFHPRLHSRLADLGRRLDSPGNFVHIVLVSTGANKIAKHGQARIDKFLKELNGHDPDPIASSGVIGLDRVYSGLATDPFQTNVTLDATLLDWSYVAAPYPAYFGLIDGAQLKSWWTQHGRRLLAANIRHSLGSTDVNNEIRNTAATSPDKFWYFNNGITLVAEEAPRAPANATSRAAGIFSFKGASVVNGAQTVSSLAKIDSDSCLGDVRVSIRVILLKSAPEGFGRDVTRTNNLQNRVEPRDFVAQDPEQKRLRQEMAIEGVEYEYVRSDDSSPSPTSCELIEMTTSLACASGDPHLAVQLKTGIGRFFADLKRYPYKAIFNPTVSGAQAFNTVLTQRKIDEWIEKKKRDMPKKSGPAWGVLVHGNRILAAAVFRGLGGTQFSQPIQGFRTALASLKLSDVCESMHQRIISAVQSHFPKRFLSVLFKNPTESKKVFESATA